MPHTENAHQFTSRRATAHHLMEGQMAAIARCWVMDVMGGITATCQHRQIGCWLLLGYLHSLLWLVGHHLMQKLSIHIVPIVCIVPSAMFWVRQEERNRVQSKNPILAGLWDPKTPSECPCCNQALSVLASRLVSAYTVHAPQLT